MKNLTFILLISFTGYLNSCGGSGSNISNIKTTELDLSVKGIPVIISVPENAEIKDGMFMGEYAGVKMYNYEVKKDDFIIDVIMDDSDETRSIEEITADEKEVAKTEEGFVEFILEESNGFIYKVHFDDYDDYKFFYVIKKYKKAIEFTEGLKIFDEFSEDDINFAYKCVKSAK